ncbi:MAG: NAD-dependent dehydratase [Acidobacteriaceae bacterium]
MTDLLLVGATGLVGQSVLRQALADNRIARVVALTRRPLAPEPRLENPLVDFDALPGDAPWWNVDAGICTLGTTMRQAGSHVAFRKVDVDYPLTVARLLHEHGAKSFAFNSSIGANPESRAFYMRVKGEVEQRLIAGGFSSLTLVRPSGILGPRRQNRRWEARAIRVFHTIRPVLPRHYRPVSPEKIAEALLEAAITAPPGVHIVESEKL